MKPLPRVRGKAVEVPQGGPFRVARLVRPDSRAAAFRRAAATATVISRAPPPSDRTRRRDLRTPGVSRASKKAGLRRGRIHSRVYTAITRNPSDDG